MANESGNPTAAWIAVLVVGIFLNSVGLFLGSGPVQAGLSVCGLLLIIAAFFGLVRQVRQKSDFRMTRSVIKPVNSDE